MATQPVKGSLARTVKLPPIPDLLDYPATRRAGITIPSRIGRDPEMGKIHIRVLIEIASAGADSQWVLMPTLKHFERVLGVYYTSISRAITALEAGRYIELKPSGRYRYVRIVQPAFELDWE